MCRWATWPPNSCFWDTCSLKLILTHNHINAHSYMRGMVWIHSPHLHESVCVCVRTRECVCVLPDYHIIKNQCCLCLNCHCQHRHWLHSCMKRHTHNLQTEPCQNTQTTTLNKSKNSFLPFPNGSFMGMRRSAESGLSFVWGTDDLCCDAHTKARTHTLRAARGDAKRANGIRMRGLVCRKCSLVGGWRLVVVVSHVS